MFTDGGTLHLISAGLINESVWLVGLHVTHRGSTPQLSTIYASLAHLVERLHDSQEVVGSIPTGRTIMLLQEHILADLNFT